MARAFCCALVVRMLPHCPALTGHKAAKACGSIVWRLRQGAVPWCHAPALLQAFYGLRSCALSEIAACANMGARAAVAKWAAHGRA